MLVRRKIRRHFLGCCGGHPFKVAAVARRGARQSGSGGAPKHDVNGRCGFVHGASGRQFNGENAAASASGAPLGEGLRWERDSAGRGCARTRRPGRDDASCGTVLVAAHCGRCVAGCTAKREPHEHSLVLGAKRAAGAAVLPPATAIRIASGTTKPGREIVRTEGGPLVSNWAEREERGVAKHMQADETDAKNRTADRRVPASKAPLPLAGGHARQNCSTRSLPVGDGPRWRTHAVGESEDYGRKRRLWDTAWGHSAVPPSETGCRK